MKTLKNLTQDQKEAIYLDWVNNYLTTEKMAEHYNVDQKELIAVIDEVRNTPKPEKIGFTRVNNDINGNPRYVCHFLSIPMNEKELEEINNPKPRIGKYGEPIKDNRFAIERQYEKAVAKARKLGGKRYNTKDFGGGIVFQSYNIHELERSILELKNK